MRKEESEDKIQSEGEANGRQGMRAYLYTSTNTNTHKSDSTLHEKVQVVCTKVVKLIRILLVRVCV